ncbi:MAG: methylglyoxal synthase [Chrysiogenales bacterium]|nr:MAG: methylglyoxal synthase [Chrysiogenales bacterium]
MIKDKTIALIAHDTRKQDMADWVTHNADLLVHNHIVCTGTTGGLVEATLFQWITSQTDTKRREPVNLTKMNSGPLGGDAQIASMVVEGKIDLCVFLIDDLTANPHEADIMMLLRQCRIHNIPVACNRHSADLMVTSSLWGTDYKPTLPIYTSFKRDV